MSQKQLTGFFGGGGGGIQNPVLHTVTIPYTNTAFRAAASTVTVFLTMLAARQVIAGIALDNLNSPGAEFTGSGFSTITVSAGSSSIGNSAFSYFPSTDVLGQQVLSSVGGWMTDPNGSNVVLVFIANQNFGNGSATSLSTGSMKITYGVLTLP